ncbi:MAG TPA: 7TM diverse intracellular signaling domain-containing protein [Cytophagaceae bacterium]|nr:7TM diverse intracellular signaling domain-containing protein [Cytophagaceae bacterium]
METLVLDDSQEDVTLLGSQLEILEDPTQKLSIEEVMHSNEFKVHTSSPLFAFIKNTKSAYWIRFSLREAKNTHKRWTFENSDPHIDNFEFYYPDKTGAYLSAYAGYAQPFDLRPYAHKNFIFDLPTDTIARSYYVRVVSNNHNPFIFKIHSANYFTFYALNEYYMLGMFYGILAIMAIYNILVYFSMKERVYILYVIYVLCCGLISLAEDGTGFQYLWSHSPALNNWISRSSPLMLMVSFSVYSKAFLELRNNLPKLNRLLDLIIAVYIAFFLLDVAILNLQWNFPLYIIPFIIIYVSAILCLRKGFRQARYYLVGYSFMIISIIFLIFRMSGIIHWSDIFTVYSFNIGLVFEIVILSFALGDRIKIIRAEREKAQEQMIEQLKENEKLKDKVNRELEQKVKERTTEIAEKNQQLEEMNEELRLQSEEITRMNLLLDSDNRKLQNNVKDLVKARVMVEEVDFEEFSKIFPSEESCYRYLAELKWDKGYVCRKCGHTRFCEGKDKYSRRCTRCRYDESPTAYTIFHRLKFDVVKAFYMVFLVYANKGKITSLELSQLLQLRQSTCWTFSKKVTRAMKERKKNAGDQDAHGWSHIILDPIEGEPVKK